MHHTQDYWSRQKDWRREIVSCTVCLLPGFVEGNQASVGDGSTVWDAVMILSGFRTFCIVSLEWIYWFRTLMYWGDALIFSLSRFSSI